MVLSKHAVERSQQRAIREDTVEVILRYGRSFFVRGAEIVVIGCKEVKKHWANGIDLSAYQGIQVVCDGDTVITEYHRSDLRNLKPRRSRHGGWRPR